MPVRSFRLNHAVWNTLHDGSIEKATGQIPGELTVTIGIEYLCRELPTTKDSLVLRLTDCTRFEYVPFGCDPIRSIEKISKSDIEILSAVSDGALITVVCVGGELRLAYGSVETRLGEGAIITQDDLEAAADRYWTKWGQKGDASS